MRASIHFLSLRFLMLIIVLISRTMCSSESSRNESTFDYVEPNEILTVYHGTDISLLKALPKDILDCILSLTDRKGRISMSVACKLFEGYKLTPLSSSVGFLYHNWIGKYRNQLKLCVCPENNGVKIEEFVSASKDKFVTEVYFSSFQFFILALQSGFTPMTSQKISMRSSSHLSFDHELDYHSIIQEASQKMNFYRVSVNASDVNDIPFLTSFLDYFQYLNVSLTKLELYLNCMPSKPFKELLVLLENFSLSSLSIEFISSDFFCVEMLNLMQRNQVNLRELHLKYLGNSDFVQNDESCWNVLFPIIQQFGNLKVFDTNMTLPKLNDRTEIDLLEILRNDPTLEQVLSWSDAPELIDLKVVLHPEYPEYLPTALELAKKCGDIHYFRISMLSSFQKNDRNLIIKFVKENSQNIVIQRLICDVNDFHEHFHKLNAADVTLYVSSSDREMQQTLHLNFNTRIIYCMNFCPVFDQTFPNLHIVLMRLPSCQSTFVHFSKFCNSYQHLKLCRISDLFSLNYSPDDFWNKLSEIYENSLKTFERIDRF